MLTTVSRIAFTVALLGIGAGATSAQSSAKLALPQASPAATLQQRVGLTDIEIKYSRPSARGRQVFGDLEPYGVVWRTGANSATTISFSTDVKFGGVDIPAGTYALASIPGKQEWTVILNKATQQWGAYAYDAKNDIARVTTTAVTIRHPVETFTIDLNDLRDDSATLDLSWQHTRVPVKLEFNTVAIGEKRIAAAMAGGKKLSAPEYDSAAMFNLEHNLDLDKASDWIEAAIAAQPDAFYLYYHQAQILAKKGDKAGAIAAAKKSIDQAAASHNPALKDEYTRLNQKIIARVGGE